MPPANGLQHAVNHELAQRHRALSDGIRRYLTHPYERRESRCTPVWQQGACRLLDFGVEGRERARMLFIPSLINRYYILDLRDGRSMTDYLRQQGIRPFVIDWGVPDSASVHYDCSDYITRILQPALAAAQGDTPLIVAGYCMGGLLAVALAQLAPSHMDGLALLATPWDFHAPQFPRVALDDARCAKLQQVLQGQSHVPGAVVQALFYASNPWLFARKYAAFSQLAPDSEEAIDFIAVESWVNDTVDMSAPVARECLIGWVQENHPARTLWQVAGQYIQPEKLALPVFAACPAHDSIVPPDCSAPLLARLRDCTRIQPASGHVGMVAGRYAASELWQPLCHWLESHF